MTIESGGHIKIQNPKLKIALLLVKKTFNKHILIGNIYFFNNIVLIGV